MKITNPVIVLSVLASGAQVLAQYKRYAFPGNAVSWGKDRIDLFGIEAEYGGQVWHKSYNGPSGGWKTEELNISAYSRTSPVAITRGKDRLDVFTTGYGLIYQTWDGKKWLPEESDKADEDLAILADDGEGTPSVTSWDSNRVDIIVKTYEGYYGRKSFNGSAWLPDAQKLEDLGKEGLGNEIFVADPASVSWGKDSLDVFGILSNGTLVHKYWNGQAWKPSAKGWQNWGDGFVPESTPTVISRAEKTLEIFAFKPIGSTGYSETWYAKWDSSKKLAWDNLGGYSSRSTKTGLVVPPSTTFWDGRIDLLDLINFSFGSVAGFHKWNEGGEWKPKNATDEDGESYAEWEQHNVTSSAVTGFTGVSWGKDNINLFFLDRDSNIQMQQWDGKAWSPKDGGSVKVENKYLSSRRAMRTSNSLENLERLRKSSSVRGQSRTVRPLVAQAGIEKLGL